MSDTARIGKTLELISAYGDIDGAHHKQWLLDQIVRVLTINKAGYHSWLAEHCRGSEGPETYAWDEGIAP